VTQAGNTQFSSPYIEASSYKGWSRVYLAIAKQVSIDTAMQYCEVMMGGQVILHPLSSAESRALTMQQHTVSGLRHGGAPVFAPVMHLWHYLSGPLSTPALVLVVVFEVRVVVLVWEELVVLSLGDAAGHGHCHIINRGGGGGVNNVETPYKNHLAVACGGGGADHVETPYKNHLWLAVACEGGGVGMNNHVPPARLACEGGGRRGNGIEMS
jgi:hypothetical protein